MCIIHIIFINKVHNCMDTNKSYRANIFKYVQKTYGTTPEYLWQKYPEYAVLRRMDNRKWYAILMSVPRNRLGLDGNDVVDILNIKTDAGLYDFLCGEPGFLRGYHMGGKWISVLLDGTVATAQIFALLDNSYKLVGPRSK